jgi:hypothetical protein
MFYGSFHQSGTNSLLLMGLGDGNLCDVEASIQLVSCKESDRLVLFVSGHPQRSILPKPYQGGSIHRVTIVEPRQTDAPEDSRRRTLDSGKLFQIVRSGDADGGVGHAHSTVTDLARLRGWSTSLPMKTAV